MIQQTSLDAFKTINLSKNQQKILQVLKESGQKMTNLDLSRALNWPINCITGRTNELKRKGIIIEVGKKIDPGTGHVGISYGVHGTLSI